jgi:hypothetical protein
MVASSAAIRVRLDRVERALQPRIAAPQQRRAPGLRDGDRDDDVEQHRDEQRLPRHDDRRQAKEQRHDGGEGDDHDRVVEGDLAQGEVRVALREAAPHEHHRGAGRRREQDQAGDIGVHLVGRQVRREHMTQEQPGEQRHREGLDQPVDAEGYGNAPPVLAHLPHRREVDAQQHRDDHHPDEDAHREIDARHLEAH